MGTFQKTARQKNKNARKPSNQPNATLNRAGGVAFEIRDPALKLITMTGGAFFAEPRFYNADTCIPTRGQGGKLEGLQERLKLVDEKLKDFASCEELNDTAREVIATAVDVAKGESAEDLLAIANWLRNDMYIRLTPQVLLVLASRMDGTKSLVRKYAPVIVKRPDEVKTCLLIHRFLFGYKSLANGLNLGLGDALAAFGERGLMKYDSSNFPTWKDVLGWIKRKRGWPLKDEVAKYFVTGDVVDGRKTPIIYARKKLAKRDVFDAEAKELAKRSMVNWEVLRSQFKSDAKEVWEFLIDERLLGYMAMLRNLRNVLQAGVSDEHVQKVSNFISSKQAVQRSKQLPFRFLSALKALEVPDVDMAARNELAAAVELASNYACENIHLPGVTAIFADNSGSMSSTKLSDRSTVSCADAANVLCGIVAKAAEKPYVFAFGTDIAEVGFTKNSTVLGIAGKVQGADTHGHNTNAYKIPRLLKSKGLTPDRVIILSDMQCWDDASYAGHGWGSSREEQKAVCDTWAEYLTSSAKAKDTWLHCIHLDGYGDAVVDEGGHINQLAGFSEKVFDMLMQTEGLTEEDPLPTVEQVREKWTVK